MGGGRVICSGAGFERNSRHLPIRLGAAGGAKSLIPHVGEQWILQRSTPSALLPYRSQYES